MHKMIEGGGGPRFVRARKEDWFMGIFMRVIGSRGYLDGWVIWIVLSQQVGRKSFAVEILWGIQENALIG